MEGYYSSIVRSPVFIVVSLNEPNTYEMFDGFAYFCMLALS